MGYWKLVYFGKYLQKEDIFTESETINILKKCLLVPTLSQGEE